MVSQTLLSFAFFLPVVCLLTRFFPLNAHVVQFKYTVGHPEILHSDLIGTLIKRELTRSIGQFQDEIFEVVENSFDNLFGIDGQWREVGVFDSFRQTVGSSINRIIVGKELGKTNLSRSIES